MRIALSLAMAAALWVTCELMTLRAVLREAPEPQWSEIYATLKEASAVSPVALWIGARLWPPVKKGTR